ncbi:MAG: OmpH family outer membrane protein [Aureispira sp.]
MIIVRKLGFLFCFLWCFSSIELQAQDNIAYVNTDEVITSMPAYRATQKSLETFQEKLVQELDAEKRSIAKYYTQVLEQVKAGQLTSKQQQEAEQKLQTMQNNLQRKTDQADQRLSDKEQSLTAPLYDQFEAALAAIAKENKYIYILDKKLLLYSGQGIDATDQMKKQLGI